MKGQEIPFLANEKRLSQFSNGGNGLNRSGFYEGFSLNDDKIMNEGIS
jgi:hypothetical protein